MSVERPAIEPIRTDFRVQFLSDEQLVQLQRATLRILEDVGVIFRDDELLAGGIVIPAGVAHHETSREANGASQDHHGGGLGLTQALGGGARHEEGDPGCAGGHLEGMGVQGRIRCRA